jgi:hypothetical protein
VDTPLTKLHGVHGTWHPSRSALVAGAPATVASAIRSETREAGQSFTPIARVRLQYLIQLCADHNRTPRRAAVADACFASGWECVDGRRRR